MKKIMTMLLVVMFSFFIVSCGNLNKNNTKDKVELIYSGSKFVANNYQEVIDCYEDYLSLELNLFLNEAFFNNNILYVYGFLNNNIGSGLYNLYFFNKDGNILNIRLKESLITSSPAFGSYTLVFSINKEYYKTVDAINITGVYGNDNYNRYYLIINDPNRYIQNKLDRFYYENDQIIIKTHVIYDASLELYVNDIFHSTQTAVETNAGYIWEFYLEMPDNDVTLTFITTDGFIFEPPLLHTITFGNNDYGYGNVFASAGNLMDKKEELESKYNVNLDDDVVLIDDVNAFREIYEILMGYEYNLEQILEGKAWLLIKRSAGGSQYIKADYNFYGHYIGRVYPHGNKAGDTAIFNVLDLVELPGEIYNELKGNDIEIIDIN